MAQSQARRSQSVAVRRLLITEALVTWAPPTAAGAIALVTVLLNALGLIPTPAATATTALALLLIGAHAALAPRVQGDSADLPISRPVLATIGLAWICVLYYPFHCRLFPGAPLASVSMQSGAPASPLRVGDVDRLDLILDAHLPAATQRTSRSLLYDFDLVNERGDRARVQGELGDRWQTRRLGRRGTTQAHVEHLSTLQRVALRGAGLLRVENVTLTGVPEATLTATVVPHRAPDRPWLLTAAVLLSAAALTFDLWWDWSATPIAAFLTATACAAAVIFLESGSGHAGVRDLIGSVLAGAAIGLPAAAVAAALARRAFPSQIQRRNTRNR